MHHRHQLRHPLDEQRDRVGGRGHDHPHVAMGVAARRDAHRLGRRRFLVDLGRGTFAVAILGPVAACSDATGDRAVPLPPDSVPDTTGDAGGGATTAAEPTTAGTTTSTAAGTTDGTSGGATDGATPSTGDTTGDSVPPAEPALDPLRWGQVGLGFVSAYVLVRGNGAAVVDTGTPGSADAIGETLATLGVTFDDVGHVVLTHRHPDHVGSLPDVIARSSTSVVAYAGAADIPNIEAPIAITSVGDGDDVFGLQVIETPGHTPGSISLLDPGIGLLVVGDALNGDDSGTSVVGPNEQFSDDMELAIASVAKLAGYEFDAVAFGHGRPVESGGGALVRALAG